MCSQLQLIFNLTGAIKRIKLIVHSLYYCYGQSCQKDPREYARKQQEREQAQKKKEALLAQQSEQRRKLNEERKLKALQQRKALDEEKAKLLEVLPE